jgi:hypothetical protein
MFSTTEKGSIPKLLLLVIAFIQGLMLLAIYRALDTHYWPWHQPVYLYPLLSLAVVTPTLCLLSFIQGQTLHYAKWIAVFTLCLLVVATYTGWQLEPGGKVESSSIGFIFVWTGLIASFKALMYIQQRGSGQAISYSELFRYSWRNFLVLALSLLFTLIFWGILYLCGALFKVIKIDFVAKLIEHDWFYIPVLTLAHGFGVLIFRNLANIIDTIAKILQVLMKFLLPALVLVSIAFLAALPFTGLETLWGTGKGSLLILWLQVLVLFFVNAVYQDESHILPYPRIIHRAIYCGIALLPIYSVIASFGLYARIVQYGLSVERCWALLLWLLLFLFALGYLWGIVRKRDQWIEKLSRVNISMGLIVLALMLLVNSPVLDFRKVSLASQMHRFESGVTSMVNLDINYIDRHLGRSGYLTLESLKTKYASSNPEFAKRIETALRHYDPSQKRTKPTLQEYTQLITKTPEDLQIPELLLSAIYAKETEYGLSLHELYMIQSDLNGDGIGEYVFVKTHENWWDADMWMLVNEKWVSRNMHHSKLRDQQDLAHLLKEYGVEIIKPEWQRLKIGHMIFTVSENE